MNRVHIKALQHFAIISNAISLKVNKLFSSKYYTHTKSLPLVLSVMRDRDRLN